MKPDATLHNPDPAYLRGLLQQAGLTQTEAAKLIGVTPRSIRLYLAPPGAGKRVRVPYPVQFALEALARAEKPTA